MSFFDPDSGLYYKPRNNFEQKRKHVEHEEG